YRVSMLVICVRLDYVSYISMFPYYPFLVYSLIYLFLLLSLSLSQTLYIFLSVCVIFYHYKGTQLDPRIPAVTSRPIICAGQRLMREGPIGPFQRCVHGSECLDSISLVA